MRILQVIPHFFPSTHFGGTPVACHHLAKHLASSGASVEVLTTDAFSGEKRYVAETQPEKIENFQVYRFRNLFNSLAYNNRFSTPIPAPGFIFGKLRSYDVVQLFEYRTLLNVLLCLCKPLTRATYTLYPQGTFPVYNTQILFKKIFDFFFSKIINSTIDRYIAISKAEKKSLIASGIPEKKIRTIYYGIDVIKRQTNGSNPFRYPFILYYGRVDKRKGIDILIKAYGKSRICEHNVHLVIAGNGDSYVNECKGLVQGLGLAKFVHFKGPISRDEVPVFCKYARVVSYVTENEAYGLVGIEAVLCGTPSIVADTSGVAEILRKFKVGHEISYGDVIGLAKLIRELGWKKVSIPERKIEKLVEEYNWAKVAQKFLRLYRYEKKN